MESYRTVQGTAEAELEDRRSRFIAQLSFADTEEKALAFLDTVRARHKTASHNVYAYVLREGARMRYSDDGEPQKTSGLPTLEAIRHAGVTDCVIVTTRYFGGTLLGTGRACARLRRRGGAGASEGARASFGCGGGGGGGGVLRRARPGGRRVFRGMRRKAGGYALWGGRGPVLCHTGGEAARGPCAKRRASFAAARLCWNGRPRAVRRSEAAAAALCLCTSTGKCIMACRAACARVCRHAQARGNAP